MSERGLGAEAVDRQGVVNEHAEQGVAGNSGRNPSTPDDERREEQILRMNEAIANREERRISIRNWRYRKEDVELMMKEERLDVLALPETFLSPEQNAGLEFRSVLLDNTPRSRGTRAAGGSAIIVRHGLEYKFLQKKFFGKCEMIIVRVDGGTLASV